MSRHINYQVIKQGGKPVFAVVPYEEFMELVGSEPVIPHEVVGLVAKKGYSLVRAWREHLGLTQQDLADRLGVKQSAVVQYEKPDKRLQRATIEKLAAAMDLDPEQLNQ